MFPFRVPEDRLEGLPHAMRTASLCMPFFISPCWASSLSLLERLSNIAGFFSMRAAGVLGAQLFAVRSMQSERAERIICFFMMVKL